VRQLRTAVDDCHETCRAEVCFPQHHPIEGFREPIIELTAEQRSSLAEAEERLQPRQRGWGSIIHALQDNSMAVFRAMHRFMPK
jgi:hypothetical protein